jgi:hydroxymethylpyrimidine pyrophosphatase-like HAD family hydrolase
LIANGGAVGLTPGLAAVHYVNALQADAWRAIAQALAGEGLSVVVFGHRHPAPPLLHVTTRQGDPHFESYLSRHTLASNVVPDLLAAEIPQVVEVAALGRGDAFEAASARVMERFASAARTHCMALYIQERYGRITEFFHPDTSKWRAFVGLFPDARPERVIAVGDEANDLEMIAAAGCGIAMGNATPELKAVARHVTAGNDSEGLALALEALLGE